MDQPLSFRAFVGNPGIIRILTRAVEQNRVPHALVFAGPEGVGKRTLAILLARRVNCLSPAGNDACGDCISCRKITADVHPDVRVVIPEGAYIRIDQVRAVIAEVAFQPFEGQYRVVVMDPADQMRPEGANSLLKTLEEPPSRTILILVTTQPYLLLPTIRSRAQILRFTAISGELIVDQLVRRAQMPLEEARLAANFSNGSLGKALAFNAAEYRSIRAQGVHFISLLLGKGSFVEVSRLAAGITKDRDQFIRWLDVVDSILQDVYFARVAPARLPQSDIAEEIRHLSGLAPRSGVVGVIRGMRSLRRSLQFNVNRQIALESLFLARPRTWDCASNGG